MSSSDILLFTLHQGLCFILKLFQIPNHIICSINSHLFPESTPTLFLPAPVFTRTLSRTAIYMAVILEFPFTALLSWESLFWGALGDLLLCFDGILPYFLKIHVHS